MNEMTSLVNFQLEIQSVITSRNIMQNDRSKEHRSAKQQTNSISQRYHRCNPVLRVCYTESLGVQRYRVFAHFAMLRNFRHYGRKHSILKRRLLMTFECFLPFLSVHLTLANSNSNRNSDMFKIQRFEL